MGALGSLYVELTASADPLLAAFKSAQTEANNTAKQFKSLVSITQEVGEAFVAMGGAMVAGIGLMVQQSAQYGAQLDLLHVKSGISVTDLSQLTYAAEQNGASMDSLGTGLKNLSKNLELAEQGSAKQLRAFDSLGISEAEIIATGGSASAMFKLLADRVSAMADPSQHAADLTAVMGKSWTELVPTLDLGSAGLKRFADQADATGKTISDLTAAQDLAFTQSLGQLKDSVQGVGISIASDFIPALSDLAAMLTSATQSLNTFTKAHPELVQNIGFAAVALTGAGGFLLGLTGVMLAAPTVIQALGLISTAFTALTGVAASGLGILGVVTALGALSYAFVQAWQAEAQSIQVHKDSTVAIMANLAAANAHGAAINADGLTIAEIVEKLAAFGKAQADAHAAVLAATKVIDDQDAALQAAYLKTMAAASDVAEEAKTKQLAFNAAVSSQVDAVINLSDKQKELIQTLKDLQAAGIPVSQIIGQLGPQILALGTFMTNTGNAIDTTTKYFNDVTIASNKADAAFTAMQAGAPLATRLQLMNTAALDFLQTVRDNVDEGAVFNQRFEDGAKALDDGEAATGRYFKTLKDLGVFAATFTTPKVVEPLTIETANNDLQNTINIAKNLQTVNDGMDHSLIDQLAQIKAQKPAYEDIVTATNSMKTVLGSFWDDVTTKGDSVWTAMKASLEGGANSIGKALFDDIGAALLGPIKQAFDNLFKSVLTGLTAQGGLLSGLTSGITNALGGIGNTGSAGVDGAVGVDGGATGGLGSLLSNPWTVGIAAAVAGVTALWAAFGAQGRKTANEFVQQFQNPFGTAIGQISNTFQAAQASGTLTVTQAQAAEDQVKQLWTTFQSQANQFATQGSNQATVVQQAFATLNPLMTQVLSDMDKSVSTLQATATTTSAAAAATSDTTAQSLQDLTTSSNITTDSVTSLTSAFGDISSAAESAAASLADLVAALGGGGTYTTPGTSTASTTTNATTAAQSATQTYAQLAAAALANPISAAQLAAYNAAQGPNGANAGALQTAAAVGGTLTVPAGTTWYNNGGSVVNGAGVVTQQGSQTGFTTTQNPSTQNTSTPNGSDAGSMQQGSPMGGVIALLQAIHGTLAKGMSFSVDSTELAHSLVDPFYEGTQNKGWVLIGQK